MTYKITASINVHILPYIEDDEHIIDVTWYTTGAEMKKDILAHLEHISSRIEDLTMKRIKEGVTF